MNYEAVADRIVGDKRFERERAAKIKIQEKGVAALNEEKPQVSSTFDAFQRMAAGNGIHSYAKNTFLKSNSTQLIFALNTQLPVLQVWMGGPLQISWRTPIDQLGSSIRRTTRTS